jgi:plastocyanin
MRRVLSGAVIVGFAAMLPACGDGGSGSTAITGPAPPSTDVVTITIVREDGPRSFSPNPAPAGGQSVVFRNTDGLVHRVRLNDQPVDTGDIAPGATSRVVQMPAGGAHYHCPIHPGMIGSVNAASGAPPPACQGPYCEDD